MNTLFASDGFDPVAYLCFGAAVIFAVCAFLAMHRFLRMMPCHRHRRALPELLPFGRDVGSGVITLKAGGMMSLYEVSGCELENLDEAALRVFRGHLARALQHLDGAWALHFCLLREASPKLECANLDDPVLQDLRTAHLEAVNAGRCHENRRLLALIRKGGHKGSLKKDPKQMLASFIKERDALACEFSLSLKLTLLEGSNAAHASHMLSPLKTLVAGKRQQVAAPAKGAALDALLSPDDFFTGTMPRMGRRHIACVAVDAYPAASLPDMLGALGRLPFPLHFSTRFICYDSLRSQAALKRRRRFFEQRRRGFLSQVMNVKTENTDHDAEAQIDDLDKARASLSAQDEIFGALTQVAVLMSEDPKILEERTAMTVKAIEDLGFTARVETVNAVEAFLSSLPGDLRSNLRRPLMSQKVLSDLLPVNAVWEGERESPCPLYKDRSPLMVARTPEGGHFYLNVHTGDLGNTLIFGPPGSGKSVLLNALIMNFLHYRGMRVWAFERGFSLLNLCRKLKGAHVILDGSAGFCPLRFLETPEERSRARDFILMLCRDGGIAVTAEDKESLTQALALLSSRDPKERTLSDLCLLLSTSQNLTRALRPHLKGLGGGLLDGNEDRGFSGRLAVFECAGLLERTGESAPVLRHLLGRIGRECERDSRPKAIVIDEAWLMFKDPSFRDELLAWLKTLRKHNAAVILATQSPSDPAATGHEEAFFNCAKTRIFLPDSGAREGFMEKHYLAAGLTKGQIMRIAQAVPKRDYFLQKPGHFSEFTLALSAQELAVFGMSGARALLESET